MRVTLKKNHTHAGRELAPGAVIEVDESTAAWLIEHEVIAPLPGMAVSASPSTSSSTSAAAAANATKE